MGCGDRESRLPSTIGADSVAPPDRGPLIAFSRVLPDEGEQLFAMRPDGTQVRQLTHAAQGENCRPSWSPDGVRLCFVSRRDGCGALYVRNRDGSAEDRLTAPHNADDHFPDWSPDGLAIVFSRGDTTGPEDLYLLDLESRAERPLTTGGLMDYCPSWSPDGSHIAFRRSFANSAGIYVIAREDGPTEFLTAGYYPSWSPLGDRIAYSVAAFIWALPVDRDGHATGAPCQLTHGPESYDRHPSWSPDGTRIAFESERLQGEYSVRHILTLTAKGGDLQDLGEGRMPDWSPRTEL